MGIAVNDHPCPPTQCAPSRIPTFYFFFLIFVFEISFIYEGRFGINSACGIRERYDIKILRAI